MNLILIQIGVLCNEALAYDLNSHFSINIVQNQICCSIGCMETLTQYDDCLKTEPFQIKEEERRRIIAYSSAGRNADLGQNRWVHCSLFDHHEICYY